MVASKAADEPNEDSQQADQPMLIGANGSEEVLDACGAAVPDGETPHEGEAAEPNSEAEGSATARSRFASTRDVLGAYQLALGRDPENETIAEANATRPLEELLDELFGSLEFHFNVNQRLLKRRPPRGNLFEAAPTTELRAWAAERLNLVSETRAALADESSWLSLYELLFRDPHFGDLISPRLQPSRAAVLEAIEETLARPKPIEIELVLEEVREDEVRGWAIDVLDPDRRLLIQLYLDGVFAAAAQPDRFRRDVQDRFGGQGKAGFVIEVPSHWRGLDRELRAELRDSFTGDVLADAVLKSGRPAEDQVRRVAAELDRVRRALATIENALPNLIASDTTPLDEYDSYARKYYPLADAVSQSTTSRDEVGLPLALLIDFGDDDPADLARTIESVLGQAHTSWSLSIAAPVETALLTDLCRRVAWRCGRVPNVVLSGAEADSPYIPPHEHWVTFPSGTILTQGALTAVASAFLAAPDASIVFGDDDDLIDGLRTNPRLRPGFDLELFLQGSELGRVVAVRSSRIALPKAGNWITEGARRAALRMEVLSGRRPLHLDYVLSSGPKALVERKADAVSAAGVEQSAGREAYNSSQNSVAAALPEFTAAIIIPTRDRPDLLGPCVDSIIASAAHNRTKFEIVVVDNGSETDPALALYKQLEERGARICRVNEPFNWALLNNTAAELCTSDVLIFLNDDTAVISHGWCDELCALAMNETVGAVGARLLYADGTVQHAGVVLRGRESYAAHEGVGLAADDPGYLGRMFSVRETMAVTGACLATRRSTFIETGGFDSATFPVEGNDIDYCLRLRSRGLRVLYTPHATLHHFESKSRGFSLEGAKKAVADKAVADLWARWSPTFPSDPYFNRHFDRRGRPFSALAPPPRSVARII